MRNHFSPPRPRTNCQTHDISENLNYHLRRERRREFLLAQQNMHHPETRVDNRDTPTRPTHNTATQTYALQERQGRERWERRVRWHRGSLLRRTKSPRIDLINSLVSAVRTARCEPAVNVNTRSQNKPAKNLKRSKQSALACWLTNLR